MASGQPWTVVCVDPSEGGESPNADLLRSRIEQQSQLIAILKQRADANLIQSEVYRRECGSLSSHVQEVELQVKEEVKRREVVEARFDVLAKNHDEMIKLKDEYKVAGQKLKADFEELQRSCHAQSLAALQDRESELTELRIKMAELEEKERAGASEHQSLLGRCHQLECRLEEEELRRGRESAEALTMKSNLLASQEKVSQLMAAVGNKQMKIDDLAHLNEQLEQLVTSQAGNIEAQIRTIDLLHTQLSEAQREAAVIKERFSIRSDEVSRDAMVVKLKADLQETNRKLTQLDKEFQAYKKHSTEVLKQERDLNSKLRHFTE